MNCYCCSNTARQAIHLVQGWEAVCRTHALEAETEEPGIAVCEIEELEELTMTTTQKIAEARRMIGELSEIQSRPMQYAAQDMAEWMSTKLDRVNELLDEAEQEREIQDMQREFNWKAEREIEEGKTA